MSLFSKRRAKLAAVVATGALLASACSGGNDPGTETLEFVDVPTDEATLTVWSFLPGNYDEGELAYAQIVDAFTTEYPQVTVDIVDMPYPTYFDQIRNATVSREGPDVITMYGGAQAYSYRDGLYPLQGAMDPAIADDLRFVDENFSPDGNLYIMPTGTYGYAVLVDQDKFAAAGIDVADGMGTWDSMLTTCTTLADQGVQPIASGWQDGFLLETLLYMISSQLLDADALAAWTAGDLPITDEVFTKSIDYILEMDDAGCFGGDEALGRTMWNDSFDQYFADKTAMLITGNLDLAEGAAEVLPGTTVVGLPQVPDSAHESMIDAGAEAGWSVTKWTKHPEAATAFVNFLASADAQKILWDLASVAPNLDSVTPDPQTSIQEAYLPLMQNHENHTGFASFPLTVLAVAERNAAPLMSGTMSTDEFFEQLVRAHDKSN